MTKPHQLQESFIVLSPEKAAFIEPADSTIYKRIDELYNDFKGHELVSCYEFDSDWDSWEKHPNGDEVVILLFGDITFTLKSDFGPSEISLSSQGQYLIVPKGVWHTAKIKSKSKVLFITPGQGTENMSKAQEKVDRE